MSETRRIPRGDGQGFNWLIPVDKNGKPKLSRQWKEMIVSICARHPEDRTPAEKAALRYDMEHNN